MNLNQSINVIIIYVSTADRIPGIAGYVFHSYDYTRKSGRAVEVAHNWLRTVSVELVGWITGFLIHCTRQKAS